MPSSRLPPVEEAIKLIVNADDFGYFGGVSRGILEGARAGAITATGVMANGPAFEDSVAALRACPDLDVGVHLNATLGVPLTSAVLLPGATELTDKMRLAQALITGRLSAESVAGEWRAQIRKSLDAGLEIRFLNSHEHVHMFPMLYPHAMRLAAEFDVPFVRRTTPELSLRYGAGAALRSTLIAVLHWLAPRSGGGPRFIGLAPSGRLTLSYFEQVFPRLRRGGVYELMCHPGLDDPDAVADPRLRRYHDWTGELACLLADDFRRILDRYRIQLVRFRDVSGASC